MDQTIKKEDATSEDIAGNIKEEKLEYCSCKQEFKEESKHDCKQEIKEEIAAQAGRTLEEHIENALQTGSLGLAVDASFLHEDEQIQNRIKSEASKENATTDADIECGTQEFNSSETERDCDEDEPANKRQRTDNDDVKTARVPVSDTTAFHKVDDLPDRMVRRCRERICRMKELVDLLKESKPDKLADLVRFKKYPVHAAVEHGSRYRLLLQNEGEDNEYCYYMCVWSNLQLGQELSKFKEENEELYEKANGYIFSVNGNFATLVVKGRALNEHGNWHDYTKLTFLESSPVADEAKNTSAPIPQEEPSSSKDMFVKTRDVLLPYPDNPPLVNFPPKSLKAVTAMGMVSYRGKNKLLVEIDGIMYQAGTDLEAKVSQLTQSCYIRIERIKANRSSRKKEAICTVIQNGEWYLLFDYNKCNMYSPSSPLCTRALDVKDIDVKGEKRKLVLTDNGQVIRFSKKCRMEKDVQVGQIL